MSETRNRADWTWEQIYREAVHALGEAITLLNQSLDRKAELLAEVLRLQQQLRDCEVSLRVYDDTSNSEYWLKYPRADDDSAGGL